MIKIDEANAKYLVMMNNNNLPPTRHFMMEACSQLNFTIIKSLLSRNAPLDPEMIYNLGSDIIDDKDIYTEILCYLLENLYKRGIIVDLSMIRIVKLNMKICQYIDINGRNVLFFIKNYNNIDNFTYPSIGNAIGMGANIYQLDKYCKSFITFGTIPKSEKFYNLDYHIGCDIHRMTIFLISQDHYAYMEDIYKINDRFACNLIYEYLCKYPYRMGNIILLDIHKEDYYNLSYNSSDRRVIEILVLNSIPISLDQLFIIMDSYKDLEKLVTCISKDDCEGVYLSLNKSIYGSDDIIIEILKRMMTYLDPKWIKRGVMHGITPTEEMLKIILDDDMVICSNFETFLMILKMDKQPIFRSHMRDAHQKMSYILNSGKFSTDDPNVLIAASYSIGMFLKFVEKGCNYKNINMAGIRCCMDVEKFLENNK